MTQAKKEIPMTKPFYIATKHQETLKYFQIWATTQEDAEKKFASEYQIGQVSTITGNSHHPDIREVTLDQITNSIHSKRITQLNLTEEELDMIAEIVTQTYDRATKIPDEDRYDLLQENNLPNEDHYELLQENSLILGWNKTEWETFKNLVEKIRPGWTSDAND